MNNDEKIKCRRLSSLKYSHRRKSNIINANQSELNDFVFKEAVELCRLREKYTGYKWNIDHIVPIFHKLACGLHVAENLQVVPSLWNFKKRNTNMNVFLAFSEHKPNWAL